MVRLVRALTVALCLLAVPLVAAPIEKAVYIVELDGAPLARSPGAGRLSLAGEDTRQRLAELRRDQDEALTAIGRLLGREVEPLHRYAVAFHGLALELTAEEAAAIAGLPGARRVQRSVPRRIASDAGPAWTGAPGIWDGSGTGGLPGTRGEGVVIGILDTGIALNHPSFADVGGDGYNHTNPWGAGNYTGWCNPANTGYDPSLPCNDKLIGVWSYPNAGGNPRDDNGHGTHTAGIAAGNRVTANLGGLTRSIAGVAPHANLIAYDVCDAQGYCYTSDLLAAIDQAVVDGVDVLNFSIVLYNYNDPWHDLVALALLNARGAGIFVTIAAGDGDYSSLRSPASAPWTLAVGTSTHNRRFRSSLTPTSGGSTLPGPLAGFGLTGAYGPAAIVAADSFGDYDCSSPFPAGTFSGQIVVCDNYYDSAFQQAQNVLAGGAGGLVLTLSGGDVPLGPHVLPTLVLSYPASQTLYNWLYSGSGHTARIAATTVDLSATNGDVFWSSSMGTGDAGLLDPDVTAPGREILAAHIAPGGYQTLSGSSMAAAHAAGAAALLRALHPTWTPSEIQSALQTTAVDIHRQDGSTVSPFEEGSGRLSLEAAARAGLVLDETAVDFRAADPGSGGSPKSLNLATLADDHCVASCGWTREVKNPLGTTTQWVASVQVPTGVGLTVSPVFFVLPPGGTQTLQITANGNNSLSDWTFARITLTEISGLAPTAHLPVATLWIPQRLLSVTKAGTGTGRVTSNPPGIDCGSDCSELYPEDFEVTLTATPDPGSAFVGWADGYCYGSYPTCSVSMYSQRSVTAYFNIPAPDRPLSNQVPFKDSINGPVSGGTWSYYYVDLGSGNSELVVDLLDLSGSVNLALRRNAKPTSSAADCSDYYSYGTYNRRCVITNPAAGRWWIGVNNDDEDVTLRYTVRASWGASSDQQLANRSPRSDFVSSEQPGAGWKYFFFDVLAGSSDLNVLLSGLSADADLYLRRGAKPDRSNYNCASSEATTLPDRCSIADPATGRWWVGINNFSAGTVTYVVTASWKTTDVATGLYTVAPCRLLDTRSGQQPLVAGVPRSLQATGACGIPSTARAVSVNVTITEPTGAGSVVLYPGDEGAPATTTIGFRAGQTRANNAILKLANNGAGTLGALAAGSQVHLIVDVNGYFE